MKSGIKVTQRNSFNERDHNFKLNFNCIKPYFKPSYFDKSPQLSNKILKLKTFSLFLLIESQKRLT